MNIQKIQLPDFLIADLYKDYLVDLDTSVPEPTRLNEKSETKIPAATSATQQIKYLGENAKNVIIMVNQPETEYVNSDDNGFLTNILKACQLSTADIAIINIARQEITYTLLKEQLKPLQVFLFNVEPFAIKLPFIIPSFQVQNYDGCTFMMAPALANLNQNTQEGRLLKSKLWMSLKKIFNIS